MKVSLEAPSILLSKVSLRIPFARFLTFVYLLGEEESDGSPPLQVAEDMIEGDNDISSRY
jgi:hypothetical protein